MKGVQAATQREGGGGRRRGGICMYDQLNMRERMARVSAFRVAL